MEGEGAGDAVVRAQAYHGMLSGGCGQLEGNKSLWLFDPGGWEGALDGPSARSTIRLRALLEDLEWQLRPVPNGFMAEGAGTTRTRMLSRESHIEPSLRAR